MQRKGKKLWQKRMYKLQQKRDWKRLTWGLILQVADDRALLQESSEITFSDEDIEVGYTDNIRPLYLATSINQILIKRALVDTGASINLIPLSALQAT